VASSRLRPRTSLAAELGGCSGMDRGYSGASGFCQGSPGKIVENRYALLPHVKIYSKEICSY
jgi:hypothetical protein